jgi:hypothetical protein
MIAATFVEFMAAVGVVVGAATATLILAEKVTGLLGRWMRRQVKEVIRPTEGRVLHHLGENGDTVPMHHRMSMFERRQESLEEIVKKIEQCPHLRGEEVTS